MRKNRKKGKNREICGVNKRGEEGRDRVVVVLFVSFKLATAETALHGGFSFFLLNLLLLLSFFKPKKKKVCFRCNCKLAK